MSELQIRLKNVTKRFGATEVLGRVNLGISEGEFLTLLGPSGCGKTTILRIIAGLESPTDGEISLGGNIINTVRPCDRDLAMVFQTYALYPHLTVRQNLLTPLLLRNLTFMQRFPLIGRLFPGTRSKIVGLRRQVNAVADTLKIRHLLDRKPGQLSGGQQQRVALGRAMVRKPRAFLMDEPLSNLDAELRVHMRAELVKLHRNIGTTFIYVTHDQAEALTMSDRIAIVMDGRILQVGSPEEVYEAPGSLKVAEFVGSPKMNTLPGSLGEDGRVLCLGMTLRRQLKETGHGNLTIGLRPEHLQVQSAFTPDCFVGKLVHRENLGSDLFLHVALNNNDSQILVRANPEEVFPFSIGDEVWVGRLPGKAMVFGPDGGRLAFGGEPSLMEEAV